MDVMGEIGAAVEQGHAGEAAEARRRLTQLWHDPAVQADPFRRCALAHYAADLEPEVADEIRWDLRALDAADAIPPDHETPVDVAAMYPSLHLNLGDAYLRAGDLPSAVHHLERARASTGALPDDGYGRMIRGGIEALGERVADEHARQGRRW
ncbi:hypothetical protein WCD74_20015 [Actinomycetospora sp. OC33-EN08]|uniref:Tetratricopeptide repeat protein n=1 Tax=Actinomycetospora aurantiaca TaxID=3129233 RepID=A0ABU8MRZ1_9PSEU